MTSVVLHSNLQTSRLVVGRVEEFGRVGCASRRSLIVVVRRVERCAGSALLGVVVFGCAPR